MKNSTKCCINCIITCLSPVRAEDSNKGGWCWKEYATAGLGGVAAVVGAPIVLSVTGFTATGVAAGSIAAGIQSAVYGGAVASGSIFAGLQSAGAAGMGAKATMALFSSGAAVTTYIKNKVAP
nr:interferon alpha-inducible protein 27-like protein 2A [Pocillopora verrucosa]